MAISKATTSVLPKPLGEWGFEWVYNVIWSPDSRYVLIMWSLRDEDPLRIRASLYDAKTFQRIWTLDDFSDDSIYRADGKIIITAGATLRSWDAKTGKFLDTLYERTNAELFPAFLANRSDELLLGRAFNQGGEDFVSEIGIFSFDRKNLDVSVKQVGDLTKLAVASDGRQFLTVFANVKDSAGSHMIFLWDLSTWQKTCSFAGDDAVFVPNRDTIAVVDQTSGKIYIYDRHTCRHLNVFEKGNYIKVFAISPTGRSIAVASA
jgi:WD40 repeat protein